MRSFMPVTLPAAMHRSASRAAASTLRADARRDRHLEHLRSVRREFADRRAQRIRGQIPLRQQARRADPHHRIGILGLMIVGGLRQRHEQRAQAGGLQLGDGHGAGAAQRQIRPRVRRGHVLDEGQNLGLDFKREIGGARRLDSPRAGLMADLRAARGIETRQRLRHDGIQALRALAAAEHQQARLGFAARKARRRLRNGGDVGAHRIADGAGVGARAKAAGKCLEHLGREMRQPAIGQAGDGVLFVNQQRNAQQPCGDAARSAHIAARAEHHARTHAAQNPYRLQHRADRTQRRQHPGPQPLAANSRDPHPLDREAVRRHQARLHARRHAEPHHADASIAQFLGYGERGEYVTAGAARHDQHRAANCGAADHRAAPGTRITAERELHRIS